MIDWKYTGFRVHRLIYILHHGCIPKGSLIDHIDGDKLNNKIENLRLTDHKGNARNARKWKSPTSSKFKGVSWYRWNGKWKASIRENGTTKHLGYFSRELAAAKAYDEAAIRLYKEFAVLNLKVSKKKLKLLNKRVLNDNQDPDRPVDPGSAEES